MKRFLAALSVPVLTGALLSGCGGGEEDQADDAASASPSDSASESTPADEPSESAPAEEPSDDGASVDPDAPGADSRYCELLSTDFATLFSNIQGPEDVTEAIDIIEQIADEAPAEVEDDWSVMEGALGTMKGALTRAAELQEKATSGEVDQKQLQKQTEQLMQDMQALDTPENAKAGDAVSKHASEYCGVQLG
jgi:hypothetical protein